MLARPPSSNDSSREFLTTPKLKYFYHYVQHTVGIDFLAKNVSLNKTTYRLHLWDTAGQEKFRSLIPTYLRDANCGIFVYDVTNSQSLKNIHEWMNLFEEYAGDDAAMVLVGNKKDLNAEKEENL